MKRTLALLLAVISCSDAFSTPPSSVCVSRREATTQLFVKSEADDDSRRSFLTTVAAVIPAIAYSNPAFASGGKLPVCTSIKTQLAVALYQPFHIYADDSLIVFLD